MDEEGKTTTYMKSTNMDNTNATSKISAETQKTQIVLIFLSPVVAVCWSKAWTNNQQRLGRQARQNFASHILLLLSYLVLPFLTVARPPTPVKDDYFF